MRKGISSFIPFTDDQATQYLAVHMPPGKLTAKRFDSTSNIYKLIKILADFVVRITTQIYTLINNINLNTAIELLPELEASVGIPNNIPLIPQGSMTLSQWYTARRNAVIFLRSKIPVYNIGSAYNVTTNGSYSLVPAGWIGDIRTTFEYYVYVLTGLTISIVLQSAQSNKFPYSFTITFAIPYSQASSVWFIQVHGQATLANNTFPITFPGVFGTTIVVPQSIINLLTIVLARVIPSFITYSFIGV